MMHYLRNLELVFIYGEDSFRLVRRPSLLETLVEAAFDVMMPYLKDTYLKHGSKKMDIWAGLDKPYCAVF